MRQLLADARRMFSSAQPFSPEFKSTFSIQRPLWLWIRPFDKLNGIFRNLHAVTTEGTIVWGSFVQVNNTLFKPGPMDAPGEIVYSFDPAIDATPQRLLTWGHRMFDLKGTRQTDPRLAAISHTLADELIRTPRAPVPKELTDGVEVFTSSLMIFRKHLPHAYISGSFFPLLVHTRIPSVIILPSCYWPEKLRAMWKK